MLPMEELCVAAEDLSWLTFRSKEDEWRYGFAESEEKGPIGIQGLILQKKPHFLFTFTSMVRVVPLWICELIKSFPFILSTLSRISIRP